VALAAYHPRARPALLKALSRIDGILGDLAPDNSLLRRVSHLDLTARDASSHSRILLVNSAADSNLVPRKNQ
jgi:hypothetical protein